MPYNSESRIRFHVVLILAIVTMVCLGAMIYFYTFRVNIDQQKEAVKGYSVEVRNINGLIQSVSDTRTAANMYVITRDRRYLDDFEKYMGEVRCRADSLLFDNPEYGAQIAEFNELLEEKRSIVAELTALFGRSDTMAPLDEVIRIYEPADTLRQIRVTTVTTDTLTLPAPKRRFFRRLADVFSARAKSAETVVVNSSVAVDTTEIPASVMVDISGAAEQVRRNYERQMATIERNVISLLSADQTISSRIAAILLDLQNDVMHSRMNEIEQYENLVRRNSTFSIVGGTLALVAIMAFIVLIVLNVNRSVRIREKLEEANLLAQKTIESRHRLLLSVSHDIKTPMNSILGYLDISDADGKLSAQEIAAMRNSGRHILALLENLLEYSGLEQGTLQAVMEPFNVRELFLETSDMLKPLTLRKNLHLENDVRIGNEVRLVSDPLKIRQIVMNLLSNAVKYTPQGGIRFTAAYRAGMLEFCVADTGAGIPAEFLAKLYEPFTRSVENSHYAEGTGLGMFVVKGLVELLNGTVDIWSEVGKGTAVEVKIPAGKAEETDAAAVSGQAPQHIILVDDDPSILLLLEDMLRRLGHDVTPCNTWTEFERALFADTLYDAILTDMEMGTFSGGSVLARTRDAGFSVPVIVMTGRGDFGLDRARRLGFSHYLCKPVSMSALSRLFGAVGSGKAESSSAKEGVGFAALEEMLGGDRAAVQEVLESFRTATRENMAALERATEEQDFGRAQALCHKMLPMFLQIGAIEAGDLLKKMDSMRGRPAEDYPGWREEMHRLLELAKEVLNLIEREYPAS